MSKQWKEEKLNEQRGLDCDQHQAGPVFDGNGRPSGPPSWAQYFPKQVREVRKTRKTPVDLSDLEDAMY